MDIKKLLVVSAPIDVPIGGFLREHLVLPSLAKKLYSYGYKLTIVIPATALLILGKYLTKADTNDKHRITSKDMVVTIAESIENIIKRSNELIDIVIPSVNVIREIISTLPISTSNIFRFVLSIPGSVSQQASSLFNIINELKAYAHLENFNRLHWKPALVYITHETPESIFLGAKIASKFDTESALLLQSIEAYHVGYRAYNIPYFGTDLISIVTNKTLYGIFSWLLHKARPILINSITPEVLLYRKFFAKRGIRAFHIVDPPNALHPDLARGNYLKYLHCRQNTNIQFLYFGRISFEKGITDLLATWKIISKKLPDSKIKIIGPFNSRNVREHVEKYIIENRLKNIEIMGAQPHKHVVEEAKRSHILLYPSYVDSFSLTVLEAVASGIISITYSIPSISFYYHGVPTVLRITPGDVKNLAETAIRVARNYENICKELVENKRSEIERFLRKYKSWDLVAESEATGILKAISIIRGAQNCLGVC